MRGKRRKNKSEITISLFSFQDIITCLSGIMILLVLLISVDIVSGKKDFFSTKSTSNLTNTEPRFNYNEEDTNKEIELLKQKELEYEFKLSAQKEEKQDLYRQFTNLKRQEQLILNRSNSIAFIPINDSDYSQRAILIECSGEYLRTVSRMFSADSSGIEEFLESLHNLHKISDYPVFIIKPSAAGYAMHLVQKVQSMGFDVGYDAMSENEMVDFGNTTTLPNP